MRLKDIKLDKLRGYNKSEISAAYSWLIQRYESGDLEPRKKQVNDNAALRVLHPTERSMISPEVYGYLLELYYLGILDAVRMERLIEYAVFRPDGTTETSEIKEWVAAMIFENEHPESDFTLSLKGNETIN